MRFVDAALGTVTAASAPRAITKYSNDSWGYSASTFRHRDIHASRPPVLEEMRTHGPSIDVRELVRLYARSSDVIALKLDVEGAEFGILDALADDPEVLCNISFLFVEYHNLKFNLTKYAIRGDAYHYIGTRIHDAMDTYPGCKLRINWRSFWSACGESMRFVWAGKSQQATGKNMSGSEGKLGKKSRGRVRRGRQMRVKVPDR